MLRSGGRLGLERHHNDVAGHVTGQRYVAAKGKGFGVVDADFVAGAVDEDFSAVGGEAEGKAIAALEFLGVNELAGLHVEGPEFAAAVAGRAVDDGGVTDLMVRREEESRHRERCGWGNRSEIEGEVCEIDFGDAEDGAMDVGVSGNED